MKLVLIQNKCFRDFSEFYSFDDIIEFSLIHSRDSIIKDNNVVENIEFDEIINRIEDLDENTDGIVLSNWLTGETEIRNDIFHSAYELATYIRSSSKNVKYLPILILSKITLEDILRYSISEPHIIRASYGTRIINPEVVIWEFSDGDEEEDDFGIVGVNINNLSKIFNVTIGEIQREYDSNIKGRIVVNDNSTSGHDIANQWGAYRMAQVAGLDMSGFSYPKTLYFKYLLSNIGLENKGVGIDCKPFYEKDLNILFIDDNFDKGWEECLKGILKNNIVKKREVVIKSSLRLEESLLKDISNDKYDLIILDYYLQNCEKGINLLKKIKEENPVVPVIIFTASNKAWNMDELYQAGADGYYVKEHPETAHDAEFSIKNFENFYETIENCLNKGKLLRKYWKKIKYIEKNLIIENKISDKGRLQFEKGRINERLMMFLGLLKKESEQTKFDKNTFFYSEWELAFLTLWSTLNEVQEFYYEKNNRFVPYRYSDSSNSTQLIRSHRNRRNILRRGQLNWKIIDTNDYLFIYKPKLDELGEMVELSENYYSMVPYSTIFLIDDLPKFKVETNYRRINLKNDKFNYSKILFMQIAFLIAKINPSNDLVNRDLLLENIFTCNEERNKLYLAHGDNFSNPNFALKYKDQRKLDEEWQKYIKQLFGIVYFLCTGEECKWDEI